LRQGFLQVSYDDSWIAEELERRHVESVEDVVVRSSLESLPRRTQQVAVLLQARFTSREIAGLLRCSQSAVVREARMLDDFLRS